MSLRIMLRFIWSPVATLWKGELANETKTPEYFTVT